GLVVCARSGEDARAPRRGGGVAHVDRPLGLVDRRPPEGGEDLPFSRARELHVRTRGRIERVVPKGSRAREEERRRPARASAEELRRTIADGPWLFPRSVALPPRGARGPREGGQLARLGSSRGLRRAQSRGPRSIERRVRCNARVDG